MEYEKLKERLYAKIREFAPTAFSLNDQMAREPELGLQEHKSSAAIVQTLRAQGIEVEYPFAGYETAFCGRIAPERKRRMALLAEYDALLRTWPRMRSLREWEQQCSGSPGFSNPQGRLFLRCGHHRHTG